MLYLYRGDPLETLYDNASPLIPLKHKKKKKTSQIYKKRKKEKKLAFSHKVCGSDQNLEEDIIRSHINFTRDCGMVLRFERFSHLSGQSFWLGFSIGLGYLSLMFLLRGSAYREMAT